MSSVDNAASATKSNVHIPLPSEKREDETPGAVSAAPVNVSSAPHPEPSPSSKQQEAEAPLPPNSALATTPPSNPSNNINNDINHNSSSTGATPTPSQQPSQQPSHSPLIGGPGEVGKDISLPSAEMNQPNALLHTAQPTSPLPQPTALVPSGATQTEPTTPSPPHQIDKAPSTKISPQNHAAQPEEDDNASIASNVQEHSVGEDSHQDLIEDTDEAPKDTETAKDPKQAIPLPSKMAQGVLPPLASHAHTTEAPVSVLSQPNHGRAIPSGGRAAPSAVLETEGGEDESSEPTASYTSPTHEWARILQRRLNKGLNDAQLARSNSMLASPSIIAQSLVQVIPSLQVKEATSRSPDSPAREYQTAEELFDRPAAIEPSTKYEDTHTRDDAFPSANISSAPLLLFAPLNPDELHGKTSKSSKQPAPLPDASSTNTVTEVQPVSSDPPTSGTQEKEPKEQKEPKEPKEPKDHKDKSQHKHLAPTSLQPVPSTTLVGQISIPVKNSPGLEPPPTGDNPSPVSPSRALVTPTNQTRSPPLARDQAKNSAPNANLSVNSRTLVNQGSSSSLTGTHSAIPKDLGTNSSNPIRPIQYTPVTQYKANPAKKRDASSSSKDPKVESPKEVRAQTEKGAPEPSVDSKLETLAASATADQWALEALSGLTEFKFDTTLPVSAVVATTLAGSTNHLAAKQNQLTPSVRRGSSASDAPVVAKVIQSPFESSRLSQIIPPLMQIVPETSVHPVDVPYQPISAAPGSPVIPAPIQGYQKVPGSGPSGHEHETIALGYGHATRGHQQGRSVSSIGDFQIINKPVERPSVDMNSYRREAGPSLDLIPMSLASAPSNVPAPSAAPTPALNLGSGYQISWLPQSRPVLPPRADVNSIDVPALTGKQMLPHDPRPIRSHSKDPSSQFKHLGEALRYWGVNRPEGNAFASIEGKGSECGSMDWARILGKAELIAKNIHEKTQLPAGARVALVFRLSEILEFVAAFYGAMLAGVVPVLVNQIQEFSEMVYIMTSTKVELALTTQTNHKALMKDVRKGTVWPSGVTWWRTDSQETWSPKKGEHERIPLKQHDLAYIEYTKSANGELKGIAVSHKNLMAQCQTLRSTFSWRPALYRDKNGKYQTDPSLAVDTPPNHLQALKVAQEEPSIHGTVMSWLEPRQQSGLIIGCIMGVYLGNFTVFVDSSITAISGLWAHSVAAYRANIAFADYNGMQRLLRNFRLNPQGTVTPTRPDLRFLHTVYVDALSSNPKFNREFLDEYLYPLGMIQCQDTSLTSKTSPETSKSSSKMTRGDLGVIAYLSLPEHGGAIISVRDGIEPPPGVEKVDFKKQYRKSTLPLGRPSIDAPKDTNAGSGATLTAEPKTASPVSELGEKGKLANHPLSSFSTAEYLLQRSALRVNKIVVLATGDEAVRRMDEPGAILVGSFGYPLAQSMALIVDPETLAISLPDVVGEIWISSPTLPVCFWGLPEHTQEVFNAKSFVVSEEEMVPTVFCPPKGYDKLLRTGILGTMIEGRLVVFGPYSKRLQQDMADPLKPPGSQYEYYHTSDLTSTLHAKVNGVGELSIFECFVNNEFLPVVCIELSKECRLAAQPLGAIAQNVAINSHHALKDLNGLRAYCIAVWEANTLPRMFENGRRVIDHALCKKMFELGRIFKILYFSTFIGDVMFNIPHGDDLANGFWSRECTAKRLQRQGPPLRYVQYSSNVVFLEAFDEKSSMGMSKFHTVTDVLIWRTITQQDEVAFMELDHRGKEQKSIPFKKFNHKVTGCAMHLDRKCGLKHGDHVILWFTQDLEYIVALHACWALGLIPIPLALPEHAHAQPLLTGASSYQPHNTAAGMSLGGAASFPQSGHATGSFPSKHQEEKRNNILRALLRIMDEVKVKAILGNNATDDYLRLKSTTTHLRSIRSTFSPQFCQTLELTSQDATHLPPLYNVTKAAKTKQQLGALSGYAPRREWFTPTYPAVYLIDPDAGMTSLASRKLLKLTHEVLNNLCRNQKLQFKMASGQAIVTCLSIFNGMGFVQGCCTGIYVGGPSVIIQPSDFSANPVIWLEALTRYKVQDATLTYPLLEQVLTRLDGTQGMPILGQVVLDSLKNLVILSHGRTQRDKVNTAITRLGQYRMESESMNMIYSHPLNFMVTSQLDRQLGPVRIHVSSRNLRFGIVTATSEVDDPTGIWLEDVGVATMYSSIAVVHPETLEICSANQVGEIWVCADSSVNSFNVPAGAPSNPTQSQPFGACITGYDNRVRHVRTGDLGFLWNGQQQHKMQLQALSNQGQRNAAQASAAAGSGSFQLFVLGSMQDAFQVHGLLHFAQDIESTAESAHANVAPQGCLSFKTPSGQIIVAVKVVSQEPEVLVSMYIPLMHAILEQHQFIPDVIALVGDNVSTARRAIDGLKPRDTVAALYSAERLSSTPEPQYNANNRNSLYGSPLLVANIPLPPGAHNPLIQSPVSYQPHSQYQPHASSAGSVPAGTIVSPTQGLPNVASSHSSSGPSSSTVAAAALPRPLSQQAFLSSPPHSGGSANGSGQSFLSELAMYSGIPATGTTTTVIRGPNSKGSQPHQVRQNSQPQPAQQQQRPVHPRQITSSENRSSSAEELRGDPNKSGVKGFMKGMNAKFTEIRRAGL
ncbi:hypothetical protein BG005_003127 [Podila minutissima]|nr:hypothetical protein BG005_003127 [Podila minutissima]